MNQSEDIARIAVELVDRCLQDPATDEDTAIVERQLGRYPRGMVAVGARCVCGRPLAVITRPLLPGGIPFPTTCYLTGPEAVRAAYERAHRLYLAFRHELAGRLGDSEEHIEGISAGGLPTRVKCLHALLAQTLVMGQGANPIGDLTLARIRDEFSPDVCRCTVE